MSNSGRDLNPFVPGHASRLLQRAGVRLAGRPDGAANPPAAWAGVGVAVVGLVMLASMVVDPAQPEVVGVIGGLVLLAGAVTAVWHFTDARAERRRPAVATTAVRPFCPYCGKPARSAARFCPTCGQRQ